MGASDIPPVASYDGVPQELVCLLQKSNTDAVEETLKFLTSTPLEGRVENNWDTWRGVYLTPPRDCPPWSLEEFDLLCNLLQSHPNVLSLDTTPGKGSGG
jgi:hypothetical protein